MVDVSLLWRQEPIIIIRDLEPSPRIQSQSRSGFVQPHVIANGFWRDLVRVSTKDINLSLSDPEELENQLSELFEG